MESDNEPSSLNPIYRPASIRGFTSPTEGTVGVVLDLDSGEELRLRIKTCDVDKLAEWVNTPTQVELYWGNGSHSDGSAGRPSSEVSKRRPESG